MILILGIFWDAWKKSEKYELCIDLNVCVIKLTVKRNDVNVLYLTQFPKFLQRDLILSCSIAQNKKKLSI